MVEERNLTQENALTRKDSEEESVDRQNESVIEVRKKRRKKLLIVKRSL